MLLEGVEPEHRRRQHRPGRRHRAGRQEAARSPEGSRVMILIADGDNTAGNFQPLEAAALARMAGVRIYVIGVGSKQERIPIRHEGKIEYWDDLTMDEDTLQRIAEASPAAPISAPPTPARWRRSPPHRPSWKRPRPRPAPPTCRSRCTAGRWAWRCSRLLGLGPVPGRPAALRHRGTTTSGRCLRPASISPSPPGSGACSRCRRWPGGSGAAPPGRQGAGAPLCRSAPAAAPQRHPRAEDLRALGTLLRLGRLWLLLLTPWPGRAGTTRTCASSNPATTC
jgi:hypothetical protein